MSQTSMAEPVRELLLALGFSLREAEESSPVPRSTYFYNLPYLQGPDSFQQAWRLGDPDRPLFAEIRMGMWRKQDVGHLLLGRRWETRTALHEIGVACEYQKALGTALTKFYHNLTARLAMNASARFPPSAQPGDKPGLFFLEHSAEKVERQIRINMGTDPIRSGATESLGTFPITVSGKGMDALEVRSPLLARLGGTPSGTAWFHYPKIAGRVDRLGGSDLPRMVLEGLDRLNVVFDGGRSPLFWRRGLFLPSLQKIHPAGLLTIGLFLFFSVKRDPAEVSIGTGTPSPRNRAC